MSKAAPDKVVVHRIELQQYERDLLSTLVTSLSARNVGEGAGSVVSSFTQASPAGVLLWGSVLAALAIEWDAVRGGLVGLAQEMDVTGGDAPAYDGPREGESAASVRERSTFGQRIKWAFADKPSADIERWLDKLGL